MIPTTVQPFQILHDVTISLENSKFLTDSCSKYAQAYRMHGDSLEYKNSIIWKFLAVHKITICFII